MSPPADADDKRIGPLTNDQDLAVHNHGARSGACLRCQELELRIAELEAAAAAGQDAGPPMTASATESPPGTTLPAVEFKALRLVPFGWGEGWQLRPSPPRRHWMDELPHAYKCLPLLLANQWGWQILCPTDVTS